MKDKDKVNTRKEEQEVQAEEQKSKPEQEEKGEAQQTETPEAEQKEKSGKFGRNAKIRELENKVAELNDRYLRLYSEFDNYRKRTSREKIEMSKNASVELITDLLPILDDFERAVKSAETSSECNPVQEGMKLILSKLSGLLERKGLKAIESKGREFDTDFHEAITQIPAETEDLKGKVVDEIEKGYLLNDKVIRYSKVVIGQ